ncbi:MAG: hypothetical protein WBD41_15355 [Rhodococcus sp. (in: high G+C Gram-positive bacteria)]|jgi:hypothetical protein|uniref:hypothetical protein n=1 Tax=Rhodococcus sp. EPR-157 TaxID=1813677 RepID=UPI0007BB0844|nr:hypothetical protein [Rhodococcus sp. EPR-157]KZF12870.1 hypothetical protein A2J03_16685 [Rhodococcus sp. EPR-157]
MKNQLFVSAGRLTSDAVGAPDVRVMPVVGSSTCIPTARFGIADGFAVTAPGTGGVSRIFGDSILGAKAPAAGNPSAAAAVADALEAAALSPAQWSALPACAYPAAAYPAAANPAARHRLAHATSVIEEPASREVSTE